MAIEKDPFDTLLSLEDEFYEEGYDLGLSDGIRAGLIEGRSFGLEKGFEKYAAMGRLHGKALIWAGRSLNSTSDPQIMDELETRADSKFASDELPSYDRHIRLHQKAEEQAPLPPAISRMEAHIRTLFALTEPESLSTENTEDIISDFNDRLKRAEGKAKIITRLTGESSHDDTAGTVTPPDHESTLRDSMIKKGDGSIEDIGSLGTRH